MQNLQERFQGCILGLAIGDALGYPLEFWDYDEVHRHYPTGILDFVQSPAFRHPIGTFSDDTQMSLAIAKALIAHHPGDINDYMSHLTRNFIEWLDDPRNDREPGSTNIAACEALKKGVSWQVSGDPTSLCCGTSMRSAPVGLYAFGRPSDLKIYALKTAEITHRHPIAIAGGLCTAQCVYNALFSNDLAEIINNINESTSKISSVFGKTLLLVPELVKACQKEPKKICKIYKTFGLGYLAHEASALALFCCFLHPDSYKDAVLEAVNLGGDADSVGCITGAIQGTRLGIHKIPTDWVHKVEQSPDLMDIANKLWEMTNLISTS